MQWDVSRLTRKIFFVCVYEFLSANINRKFFGFFTCGTFSDGKLVILSVGRET